MIAAALGALIVAPSASAAVTKAFNNALNCTKDGQGRVSCQGIVKSWDGSNIDVNLFLPTDTPPGVGFPLIGVYHGWGGAKVGLDNRWLGNGYAEFSITDRGWGASCGQTDSKRITDPAGCQDGYNHLLDDRYEVRDAQYLMGLLVDDGIADPNRIGAIGGSYGGGMSMALAALKDRIMLPDGSYETWMSPGRPSAVPPVPSTPIHIAGATPEIPWTDLANSLQPNGATLDYVADAPYRGFTGNQKRIGVLKQSFVAGLYATGQLSSQYAAPGTDPDADLTTWYGSINAGEPYDSTPLANDIVDEITAHHSSYYIDHSEAPAPLLISNGWTDDLFPPDEAIRFYNRTRTQYPGAHIGLFFLDYGHMRGRGATGDTNALHTAQNAWLDHFVKGTGPAPTEQVSTLPQVCNGANPSGAVVSAANWAALAPGEVRYSSEGDLSQLPTQVIAPQASSAQSGQAFDPVAGGGNACATASAADETGTANYRLPAAPAGGYTLAGSPTIDAYFFNPGPNSQIAARLLDVRPDGNETLVDRGLWRPDVNPDSVSARQVFQLHPNRWHFDAGHVAKLELLPADQPYGRNSNGQTPITVSNLQLRIPTLETPGSAGGAVQAPAGKIVPPGYALAADFTTPNDTDHDGWPNDADNCPSNANSNQVDSDGDGIGDACDSQDDDADDDGVADANDNCPNDSNPSQLDSDRDGTGDVCDSSNNNDIDEDGVANADDNCPSDANPGQQDGDGDGIGNACDDQNGLDLDDDGVADADDNCPGVANPGQLDDDNDGNGNACDSLDDNDVDGDGVDNADDNCVSDANSNQQNSDDDDLGDQCDTDDDNDGVLDGADACRTVAAMTADGCPAIEPLPGQGTQSSGGGSTTTVLPGQGTTKTVVKKCKKVRRHHKRKRRYRCRTVS